MDQIVQCRYLSSKSKATKTYSSLKQRITLLYPPPPISRKYVVCSFDCLAIDSHWCMSLGISIARQRINNKFIFTSGCIWGSEFTKQENHKILHHKMSKFDLDLIETLVKNKNINFFLYEKEVYMPLLTCMYIWTCNLVLVTNFWIRPTNYFPVFQPEVPASSTGMGGLGSSLWSILEDDIRRYRSCRDWQSLHCMHFVSVVTGRTFAMSCEITGQNCDVRYIKTRP